jgi:hypothetical protein
MRAFRTLLVHGEALFLKYQTDLIGVGLLCSLSIRTVTLSRLREMSLTSARPDWYSNLFSPLFALRLWLGRFCPLIQLDETELVIAFISWFALESSKFRHLS